SPEFDEALRRDRRDQRRLVLGQARRDRRIPRPQRRRQDDGHADPGGVHAGHPGHRHRRRLRRLHPVARGAPADRLPARERAALPRDAGRVLPRLRRRGQGRGPRGASAAGGGGDGPLPDRGRPAPADRQAVQGLPAARRARAGDRERSRGADSRRADDRPRPEADRGDPRADQVTGGPAHGDPLDAHPARGLDALPGGDHHQQRRRGRARPHRPAGRAGLPAVARAAPAGGAARRRAGGDPTHPRRSERGAPGPERRRRHLCRRGPARSGRPVGALPARGQPEVAAARAAPDRHDARGGLHPHRRRRGGLRVKVWPIFKKEMLLYFSSPVAYAVITLFLLIVGYFFYLYFARLEWGPLFTGYLGLLLMGGACLAVGLLASSLTENQIVAAFATFVVLLIFWVIGWSADYTGGLAGRVLSHLSLVDHFESFSKGVIDSRDVIYYADFMVLALFLTLRSLEARRWKG